MPTHIENPRIVVSITGIDALGGFSATREVWPHLQGAALRAVLEEAAASCVEQALRQHAQHVDQQGRPGTKFLYGRPPRPQGDEPVGRSPVGRPVGE